MIVTTAGIPEARRFALWRNIVSERFVPLDCERRSSAPFLGELSTFEVGDLAFMSLRGRDYSVIRTPERIREACDHIVIVTLQVRGNCRLGQDGREVTMSPGDIACCDSTRPYVATVSDDFESISMRIPRAVWLSRLGPTEQVTARLIPSTNVTGAIVNSFLHQFVSMAESIEQPAARQRLADISLSLVTVAYGDLLCQLDACGSRSRLSLLYRAKALIDQHLGDSSLDREAIARKLGVSVRYLQQAFADEHCTVSDWIWKRRLEQCAQDLSNPGLAGKSIGRIAFDNGFNDFSHFCRRFKSAYGHTPSEYRRLASTASH